MPSLVQPTFSSVLLILASLAAADYPVLSASITWYNDCAPSHLSACGPTAETPARTAHIGYAATNRVNYESGSASVNGVGKGCGTCWHIQPLSNPNPMNGNHFGNATVVKINDECTDGGYCDQTVGQPPGAKVRGNTKYGKEVHFDLCTATGVADAFFGDIDEFGQLVGLAQQVDCGELTMGEFGMDLPPLGPVSDDGSGGEEGGAEGSTASSATAPPAPSSADLAAGTDKGASFNVLDTPQTPEDEPGNMSTTLNNGVARPHTGNQLPGKLAGNDQHSEEADKPANEAEAEDDSICEL